MPAKEYARSIGKAYNTVQRDCVTVGHTLRNDIDRAEQVGADASVITGLKRAYDIASKLEKQNSEIQNTSEQKIEPSLDQTERHGRELKKAVQDELVTVGVLGRT